MVNLAKHKIFSRVDLGISVPSSWLEILDWFGEETDKFMKMGQIPDTTRAVEVKEKFEDLRIYTNQANALLDRLIDVAQAKVRMLETGDDYYLALVASGNLVEIKIIFKTKEEASDMMEKLEYSEVKQYIENVMKKE